MVVEFQRNDFPDLLRRVLSDSVVIIPCDVQFEKYLGSIVSLWIMMNPSAVIKTASVFVQVRIFGFDSFRDDRSCM